MSARLFPFWWLVPVTTCADVRACLEGDFSSWTQEWISAAMSNADALVFGAVDIENDRVYIYDDYRYFVIVDLSDGTIISEETILSYGGNIIVMDHSLLGRYMVIIESAEKIRVYKDGALIQTIEVSGADWAGVVISYNGEYIIAVNDDDDKVYCYKGS